MKAIFLCAALAAFWPAAPAAAAKAQAAFYVRNDTRSTLACVTWPAGSSRRANLTLSPGEEWTLAARPKPRFLACSPSPRQLQLRLEPGRRYRLVRDPESDIVVLRPSA